MVILQCQGDDVSVGVFARMIRLGRVLDGVAGCDESDFLHYLGLAYVPWPVVDVNQLKSYRRGERNEISVRLASVLQCLVVGHDSAILHNEKEGSHWSYPNHEWRDERAFPYVFAPLASRPYYEPQTPIAPSHNPFRLLQIRERWSNFYLFFCFLIEEALLWRINEFSKILRKCFQNVQEQRKIAFRKNDRTHTWIRQILISITRKSLNPSSWNFTAGICDKLSTFDPNFTKKCTVGFFCTPFFISLEMYVLWRTPFFF